MTDLQRAVVYVPITKIEKADGGRSRIVTGVAASDRLDYDGQRASYDWLKAQLADWFKVGNMRQDHTPGGVGKALTLEFDDEARTATVVSKAVDSDTILKLDEKILTGYSWGAKSVPGNPIRVRKGTDGVEWIESGKIVEVSYVDSPANPDCFVSLVKSAGKRGLQVTKQLGDLEYGGVTIVQAGDASPAAVLKGMLADIAKRDISAAERDRLGAQGHAIDTGQDHPSYAIANRKDLQNAIKSYGRANPEDRAKLRRHIISEARRLGATDLIPDDWKSVTAFLAKQSMVNCTCCDDCGPDCQGDCCADCTMSKAAGPAAILAGVRALEQGETDTEHRAFLGKLAAAVDAWTREPSVSIEVRSFRTLAALNRASAEPDLVKRRMFYTQQNRADVEQAMQNLHQTLGLFMEGAAAFDADKDQRDNTLTGEDAPASGDQPGGPGTAPEDGVPDDGNMAWDPSLTQDGDPAIRQPDGQRDGRAQGEAGTHTWPPAGDAPGQGPGDQGKGETPGGKGKPGRATETQEAPTGTPARGQDAPSKGANAERKLAKAKAELAELRKGVQPQPVAITNTVGQPAAKKGKAKVDKALSAEVKGLGDEIRKALQDRANIIAQQGGADISNEVIGKVEKRFAKRLRKLLAQQPAPDQSPLAAQIDALTKAVTAAAARPAENGDRNIDSSLLLADLTRAAYEQTRKDLTEATDRLAKRVKRGERRLRKASAADSQRLGELSKSVSALGRLPHPGGPQLVRPTDKTITVNDTMERSLSAELLTEVQLYNELAKSTDLQVAAGARQQLKNLAEKHGLTG